VLRHIGVKYRERSVRLPGPHAEEEVIAVCTTMWRGIRNRNTKGVGIRVTDLCSRCAMQHRISSNKLLSVIGRRI
jgi:hypothetical protein